MTFLNPAVLFGLLAASIPVLIHLFNLRKLKKIEFSTLIFLKELQKNKIRKVKLKQWLLLLLRTLIILFLVFGFARPTLKSVFIGNSSTAKTTAVFILDDTFSMSVVDAKGSYLNQEKEIALRLLSQLQDGDEVALILVSDVNYQSAVTTDFAQLKKNIELLSVSNISGSLQTALIKAAKLFDQSSNYNKEIYLLSDFQKSRIADRNQFPNLSEAMKEGIRVYAFPLADKEVFNVGVDKISVNSQIFEKDKPVQVSAFITNYAKQKIDNSVVSLFINGERTSQKSFSLKANETKEIVLEGVIKKSGYQEISAVIEDDEILQDNNRFTQIYVPEKIPVLILAEELSDATFVQYGLQAANTNQQLQVDVKQLNQLPSIDLQKYSSVILVGIAGENISSLIQFIQAGNGLFFFPGSTTSLQNYHRFCAAFQIPKANNLSAGGIPFRFVTVDYEHPLFSRLFEDKKKKSIESPEIYSAFLQRTEGKGKSLITLANNISFLSEFKIDKGKIFVASTAPVLTQTNFPLKGIFAPLLYESVLYLSSIQKDNVENLAGDKLTVNLSGNVSGQVAIVKPGNETEFFSLDDKANEFQYINTTRFGIYYFSSANKIIQSVSVNANPLESKTDYAEQSDINEYFTKIKSTAKLTFIKKDESSENIIKKARFGTELWKYFVLLAFLFALIEMFVSKSSKKDLTSLTK
ncbi:MAG: BatA domain-containing protein [Ignavibacteriaceae bacterium]|nr:BatA domain-containing protein [Ignavibacteriaceae bacterium]